MAANIELTFLKAFMGLIQGNFRLGYIFWYKTPNSFKQSLMWKKTHRSQVEFVLHNFSNHKSDTIFNEP